MGRAPFNRWGLWIVCWTLACAAPPPDQPQGQPGQIEPPVPTAPVQRPRPSRGAPCFEDGDCDDGRRCNGAESCVANRCQAGQAPCDDADPCTTDTCMPRPDGIDCASRPVVCPDGGICDPLSGACGCDPDAPCDDGDPCTIDDACADGVCQGTDRPCDDDDPCTADVCLPDLGCAHAPLDDGTPCDDDDACTALDHCLAGACVGDPLPCDDSDPCTDDTCDDAGLCLNEPIPDCDPDDAGGGSGGGGGASCPGCDDGNPCTTNSCDAGGACVFVPNTAPCDDGNPCTTGDTCAAGACVGGGPTDCDDGNPCTVASCEAAAGCVQQPLDGGDCDNPCTPDGVCAGGVCTGTSLPAGTPCDDGDACTSSDACSAGVCIGTGAAGCVPCSGSGPCNDGDACTLSDTCVAGICQSGAALDCDDSNPCTADTCDPAAGCVTTPTTAPCDDDNACTINDACAAGVCVGEFLASCDHPLGVVCVRTNASGANDGSNWLNAYRELQDALDAAEAAPGSITEIWVAAGTHRPDYDAAGDLHSASRAAAFRLRSGVALYGGFDGGEVMRSQRDPVANPTILSGDVGLIGNTTDNSFHVVRAGATTDATAVLDGFVISGGNADDASGGGLRIEGGSPTIRNCTFRDNRAGHGAVSATASFAVIDDCRFLDNISVANGGSNGGALNIQGGGVTVSDCLFAGNTAAFGGGILTSGEATIINCTFYGNTAVSGNATEGGGGGLYVLAAANPTVANCIFWNNQATGFTGEAAQIHDDAPENSYRHNCIEGLSSLPGPGNIGSDPLLVAPAAGDFRLAGGSPCIDAGDSALVIDATAIDGGPRQTDGCAGDSGTGPTPIVDLGAFEAPPCGQ